MTKFQVWKWVLITYYIVWLLAILLRLLPLLQTVPKTQKIPLSEYSLELGFVMKTWGTRGYKARWILPPHLNLKWNTFVSYNYWVTWITQFRLIILTDYWYNKRKPEKYHLHSHFQWKIIDWLHNDCHMISMLLCGKTLYPILEHFFYYSFSFPITNQFLNWNLSVNVKTWLICFGRLLKCV